MGNIHAVGPNEALVISGGCCGNQKVRKIVGKWGWAWWFVTEVQRLSLAVMTLNPICENVETAEGVPLSVTGVAQIKVMRNDELLSAACEQFLGKDRDEIENTILQTLEGHLRAILGTLSVEEIYSDRDQFALQVREVAAPDVGRMGIEILSFTIKDVYDKVDYLDSLGVTQISSVKRDADIGVALAERDAGIRETECEKTRENSRLEAETIIAESRKNFELKKAEFDSQVNTAKAECELAYQLQEAKERQKIRNEEVQIDFVKKKKDIELEDQEIVRNEKSLDATVRQPAIAEAYRLEQLAEGNKIQRIYAAEAQAEAIRLKGLAEADAIVAVGNAEAEGMKLKAAAYSKYGKAAMLSQVLDTMPKIAAEICSPLSKVEEIVLLGGNNNSNDLTGLLKAGSDLTNLCGTFPPAVKALTGVDLSKVMGKVPGAVTQ